MQFIDLHAQQKRLKAEIDAGIADVLSHGRYILGPQVVEFETQLAKFAQARHAVSCANGTDAITLPLMAWSIGPGDAVFCPSFSYCATAEVIALRGATPVFVDIDRDTYNMDPDSLRRFSLEKVSPGWYHRTGDSRSSRTAWLACIVISLVVDDQRRSVCVHQSRQGTALYVDSVVRHIE